MKKTKKTYSFGQSAASEFSASYTCRQWGKFSPTPSYAAKETYGDFADRSS